jgi:Bax protein
MRISKSSLVIPAVLILLLLPLPDSRESHEESSSLPAAEVFAPTSHRDLEDFFAAHDYDWGTVSAGVPPFILKNFPADFSRIPEIDQRKRLFFLSLLPMILLENEEIMRQRQELQVVFATCDRGDLPDGPELRWLADLAGNYRAEANPLTLQGRLALLRRLDVIPPALVLAQAANESGYGTSRFALHGNNLFGEWTFIPGQGMIPLKRPAGEVYQVRRFASVYDSVKSYMRNLNTNEAYRLFRSRRAYLRANAQPLLATDLAGGLERYSERGPAYIDDIRSIIQHNRLTLLSAVNLRLPSSDSESASETDLFSCQSNQFSRPEKM